MLKKGDRFETFVLYIDSVHKCINKIKQEIISETGLKGVHTLWLYELYKSPDGLTSAQLAQRSNIDRSLVSREVRFLIDEGYITLAEGAKKRGYNTRLRLTDSGAHVALKISEGALNIQQTVNRGIAESELETFYSVLSRLVAGFEDLCLADVAKEPHGAIGSDAD